MEKFMNWFTSVNAPTWVDPLRILVGGFIVYKGIIFTNNFQSFTANIESVGWYLVAAHLAQAIIFIHLVCGIILILGAATRLMSLVNIPILAGAVIFNYKQLLTADNYMEFEMAIAVLVLLVLVFYMGSGRFSLDYRRKQHELEEHVG